MDPAFVLYDTLGRLYATVCEKRDENAEGRKDKGLLKSGDATGLCLDSSYCDLELWLRVAQESLVKVLEGLAEVCESLGKTSFPRDVLDMFKSALGFFSNVKKNKGKDEYQVPRSGKPTKMLEMHYKQFIRQFTDEVISPLPGRRNSYDEFITTASLAQYFTLCEELLTILLACRSTDAFRTENQRQNEREDRSEKRYTELRTGATIVGRYVYAELPLYLLASLGARCDGIVIQDNNSNSLFNRNKSACPYVCVLEEMFQWAAYKTCFWSQLCVVRNFCANHDPEGFQWAMNTLQLWIEWLGVALEQASVAVFLGSRSKGRSKELRKMLRTARQSEAFELKDRSLRYCDVVEYCLRRNGVRKIVSRKRCENVDMFGALVQHIALLLGCLFGWVRGVLLLHQRGLPCLTYGAFQELCAWMLTASQWDALRTQARQHLTFRFKEKRIRHSSFEASKTSCWKFLNRLFDVVAEEFYVAQSCAGVLFVLGRRGKELGLTSLEGYSSLTVYVPLLLRQVMDTMCARNVIRPCVMFRFGLISYIWTRVTLAAAPTETQMTYLRLVDVFNRVSLVSYNIKNGEECRSSPLFWSGRTFLGLALASLMLRDAKGILQKGISVKFIWKQLFANPLSYNKTKHWSGWTEQYPMLYYFYLLNGTEECSFLKNNCCQLSGLQRDGTLLETAVLSRFRSKLNEALDVLLEITGLTSGEVCLNSEMAYKVAAAFVTQSLQMLGTSDKSMIVEDCKHFGTINIKNWLQVVFWILQRLEGPEVSLAMRRKLTKVLCLSLWNSGEALYALRVPCSKRAARQRLRVIIELIELCLETPDVYSSSLRSDASDTWGEYLSQSILDMVERYSLCLLRLCLLAANCMVPSNDENDVQQRRVVHRPSSFSWFQDRWRSPQSFGQQLSTEGYETSSILQTVSSQSEARGKQVAVPFHIWECVDEVLCAYARLVRKTGMLRGTTSECSAGSGAPVKRSHTMSGEGRCTFKGSLGEENYSEVLVKTLSTVCFYRLRTTFVQFLCSFFGVPGLPCYARRSGDEIFFGQGYEGDAFTGTLSSGISCYCCLDPFWYQKWLVYWPEVLIRRLGAIMKSLLFVERLLAEGWNSDARVVSTTPRGKKISEVEGNTMTAGVLRKSMLLDRELHAYKSSSVWEFSFWIVWVMACIKGSSLRSAIQRLGGTCGGSLLSLDPPGLCRGKKKLFNTGSVVETGKPVQGRCGLVFRCTRKPWRHSVQHEISSMSHGSRNGRNTESRFKTLERFGTFVVPYLAESSFPIIRFDSHAPADKETQEGCSVCGRLIDNRPTCRLGHQDWMNVLMTAQYGTQPVEGVQQRILRPEQQGSIAGCNGSKATQERVKGVTGERETTISNLATKKNFRSAVSHVLKRILGEDVILYDDNGVQITLSFEDQLLLLVLLSKELTIMSKTALPLLNNTEWQRKWRNISRWRMKLRLRRATYCDGEGPSWDLVHMLEAYEKSESCSNTILDKGIQMALCQTCCATHCFSEGFTLRNKEDTMTPFLLTREFITFYRNGYIRLLAFHSRRTDVKKAMYIWTKELQIPVKRESKNCGKRPQKHLEERGHRVWRTVQYCGMPLWDTYCAQRTLLLLRYTWSSLQRTRSKEDSELCSRLDCSRIPLAYWSSVFSLRFVGAILDLVNLSLGRTAIDLAREFLLLYQLGFPHQGKPSFGRYIDIKWLALPWRVLPINKEAETVRSFSMDSSLLSEEAPSKACYPGVSPKEEDANEDVKWVVHNVMHPILRSWCSQLSERLVERVVNWLLVIGDIQDVSEDIFSTWDTSHPVTAFLFFILSSKHGTSSAVDYVTTRLAVLRPLSLADGVFRDGGQTRSAFKAPQKSQNIRLERGKADFCAWNTKHNNKDALNDTRRLRSPTLEKRTAAYISGWPQRASCGFLEVWDHLRVPWNELLQCFVALINCRVTLRSESVKLFESTCGRWLYNWGYFIDGVLSHIAEHSLVIGEFDMSPESGKDHDRGVLPLNYLLYLQYFITRLKEVAWNSTFSVCNSRTLEQLDKGINVARPGWNESSGAHPEDLNPLMYILGPWQRFWITDTFKLYDRSVLNLDAFSVLMKGLLYNNEGIPQVALESERGRPDPPMPSSSCFTFSSALRSSYFWHCLQRFDMLHEDSVENVMQEEKPDSTGVDLKNPTEYHFGHVRNFYVYSLNHLLPFFKPKRGTRCHLAYLESRRAFHDPDIKVVSKASVIHCHVLHCGVSAFQGNQVYSVSTVKKANLSLPYLTEEQGPSWRLNMMLKSRTFVSSSMRRSSSEATWVSHITTWLAACVGLRVFNCLQLYEGRSAGGGASPSYVMYHKDTIQQASRCSQRQIWDSYTKDYTRSQHTLSRFFSRHSLETVRKRKKQRDWRYGREYDEGGLNYVRRWLSMGRMSKKKPSLSGSQIKGRAELENKMESVGWHLWVVNSTLSIIFHLFSQDLTHPVPYCQDNIFLEQSVVSTGETITKFQTLRLLLNEIQLVFNSNEIGNDWRPSILDTGDYVTSNRTSRTQTSPYLTLLSLLIRDELTRLKAWHPDISTLGRLFEIGAPYNGKLKEMMLNFKLKAFADHQYATRSLVVESGRLMSGTGSSISLESLGSAQGSFSSNAVLENNLVAYAFSKRTREDRHGVENGTAQNPSFGNGSVLLSPQSASEGCISPSYDNCDTIDMDQSRNTAIGCSRRPRSFQRYKRGLRRGDTEKKKSHGAVWLKFNKTLSLSKKRSMGSNRKLVVQETCPKDNGWYLWKKKKPRLWQSHQTHHVTSTPGKNSVVIYRSRLKKERPNVLVKRFGRAPRLWLTPHVRPQPSVWESSLVSGSGLTMEDPAMTCAAVALLVDCERGIGIMDKVLHSMPSLRQTSNVLGLTFPYKWVKKGYINQQRDIEAHAQDPVVSPYSMLCNYQLQNVSKVNEECKLLKGRSRGAWWISLRQRRKRRGLFWQQLLVAAMAVAPPVVSQILHRFPTRRTLRRHARCLLVAHADVVLSCVFHCNAAALNLRMLDIFVTPACLGADNTSVISKAAHCLKQWWRSNPAKASVRNRYYGSTVCYGRCSTCGRPKGSWEYQNDAKGRPTPTSGIRTFKYRSLVRGSIPKMIPFHWLYVPVVAMRTVIPLLHPKHACHVALRRLSLRCFEVHHTRILQSYALQFVQALRVDPGSIYHTFLLDYCQAHLAFRHFLICLLSTEFAALGVRDGRKVKLTHPDCLPTASRHLVFCLLMESNSEASTVGGQKASSAVADLQVEMFDRLVSLSGHLLELPLHLRASSLREHLTELQSWTETHRNELEKCPIYLPMNPELKISGFYPNSAKLMQSAAKVPYLLEFAVAPHPSLDFFAKQRLREILTLEMNALAEVGDFGVYSDWVGTQNAMCYSSRDIAGSSDNIHLQARLQYNSETNEAVDSKSVSLIFKLNDDVRQDMLALYIMDMCQRIFDRAGLPLRFRFYSVVPYRPFSNVTARSLARHQSMVHSCNENCCELFPSSGSFLCSWNAVQPLERPLTHTGILGGIIEVVPNAKSRHQLGKLTESSLDVYFNKIFGNPDVPINCFFGGPNNRLENSVGSAFQEQCDPAKRPWLTRKLKTLRSKIFSSPRSNQDCRQGIEVKGVGKLKKYTTLGCLRALRPLKRNSTNTCGATFLCHKEDQRNNLEFTSRSALDTYKKAQWEFLRSLAAYSILSFLLQVKDRHNANLLITDDGGIIHIDFGFVFDISPGHDIRFEKAPFKLTLEMIRILGGSSNAPLFKCFERLVIQGYLAIREEYHLLSHLVGLLLESGLPCFKEKSLKRFRERLQLGKSPQEAAVYMQKQIIASYNALSTRLYDVVQSVQHGIAH